MPDSITDADVQFLRRAVQLAMDARGHVEPNPMVGCLIVKHGEIIAQGIHERFGGPHAEPNALAACRESPIGATAYVTLEPCCHLGKKTPPCVPALIAAGVARVVVGSRDPNPKVNGAGIAELRKAGIRVDEADDARCRQLLAPFIARIVRHRPYITLKWAQSADGKVAGPGGKPIRISNTRSHRALHELRRRCDAILVGMGTVASDDPLLTARHVEPMRPLMRIVLDSDLRLPVDSQLVRTQHLGRVIAFCSKEAADYSGTRVPLAAAGVEIYPVPSVAPGRLDLHHVAEEIAKLDVTHLLIEPGPTLAASFLQNGPWDRAWIFRCPHEIHDPTAPSAASVPESAIPIATIDLDGDIVTEFLNPRETFGGSYPSADFVSLADAAGNFTLQTATDLH